MTVPVLCKVGSVKNIETTKAMVCTHGFILEN